MPKQTRRQILLMVPAQPDIPREPISRPTASETTLLRRLVDNSAAAPRNSTSPARGLIHRLLPPFPGSPAEPLVTLPALLVVEVKKDDIIAPAPLPVIPITSSPATPVEATSCGALRWRIFFAVFRLFLIFLINRGIKT